MLTEWTGEMEKRVLEQEAREDGRNQVFDILSDELPPDVVNRIKARLESGKDNNGSLSFLQE
jgi:hypothetical protein